MKEMITVLNEARKEKPSEFYGSVVMVAVIFAMTYFSIAIFG